MQVSYCRTDLDERDFVKASVETSERREKPKPDNRVSDSRIGGEVSQQTIHSWILDWQKSYYARLLTDLFFKKKWVTKCVAKLVVPSFFSK